MSGEINDWSWWIHPRSAVADTIAALGCPREVAIAAIVRRLLAGKIVSVTGEYRGPKDESNHLRPDIFQDTMILWRGLWMNDVFKGDESPVWTVGDLEASLQGQRCYFFNIRLHRADFEATLRDCGALPVNDNRANGGHDRPVAPADPITPAKELQSKWAWDHAFAELIAIANSPDGLYSIKQFEPGRRGEQAKIERWFADYFGASTGGESPPTSECRRRAKIIIDRLTLNSPNG